MSTATIYQDANLHTNGQTLAGDRHPASALAEVLLAIDAEELAVNTWDAAAEAVGRIPDEETVRLALSHLLALHAFGDKETEPQVAMRNVKVGDYVRLHGIVCYVREVRDQATSRIYTRGIHLKVNYHGPDGTESAFSYSANVTIPLVYRPVPEKGQPSA